MQSFLEKLSKNGQNLKRRGVDVLQVNLGRYCNLACIHCHVESGPMRKEMMSRENVDAVLTFLARTGIPTLDLTGGAPELHPDFAHLVSSARGLGRHVMDRCNLTVIFEPGMEYLPEFFKRQKAPGAGGPKTLLCSWRPQATISGFACGYSAFLLSDQ